MKTMSLNRNAPMLTKQIRTGSKRNNLVMLTKLAQKPAPVLDESPISVNPLFATTHHSSRSHTVPFVQRRSNLQPAVAASEIATCAFFAK